jgi:hypothetical protein
LIALCVRPGRFFADGLGACGTGELAGVFGELPTQAAMALLERGVSLVRRRSVA